jgi:hypothetical protein
MRMLLTAIVFFAATDASSTECRGICASTHLSESSTVPGVPVGIALEITNSSAAELTIENSFRLRVVPLGSGSGRPFYAESLRSRLIGPDGAAEEDALPGPMSLGGTADRFTVRSGGRLRVSKPVSLSLTEPAWLGDHRLNRPGKYEVAIEYTSTAAGEAKAALAAPAMLTVAFRTERDAEAWAFLEREGRGGWGAAEWGMFGPHFVKAFREKFPDTAYAFFTAGAEPMELEERIAHLSGIIDANPNEAFTDVLRLTVAELTIQMGHNRVGARDPEGAVRFFQSARAQLTSLARNSDDVDGRQRAADRLSTLPSSRQTRELAKE